MPTVRTSERFITALEAGQTLTVTADAQSSGLVRRVLSSGGNISSGLQASNIAAGATRNYGPFPTLRHYSVEVAGGTLTYTVSVPTFDFATELGNVESFTGSMTLRAEDNGKILRCDDSSNVTITVPNDLPSGYNIGLLMWGAGTVTVAAGSGATNRMSVSALSTQYQAGSLFVAKNTNGSTAEFILRGDFV